MFSLVSRLILTVVLTLSSIAWADDEQPDSTSPTATTPTSETADAAEAVVNQLDEPLYTPFVERYMLDELKSLRAEMAAQKHELMQQILDRELSSVDRGVAYATDTITYFFYIVAAASSILVIVGWTSIRDIKERVHSFANEEINKLINEYEGRLANIEKQLRLKTQDIEENREEIEATRETHSLWLRAQQEQNPSGKIMIYDQILAINASDVEALTYKADAVLELNEPQWAINLCNLALSIDENNVHAFFQLACAQATLGYYEESLKYIQEAYQRNENYREPIMTDVLLEPVRAMDEFKEMFGLQSESKNTDDPASEEYD
ncbi:TPR end-of-group domain-containing protein [Reinekea blandensis]|uniref:TPR repeat domain protein n=1 Tax=Reinekea blandensis MED297 TaxID=314283 RepID=A4BKP4_9GAMM|nr:hypothetical protein [Reinekea blandensis]EAR07296.1 TPR repeat domain protein [Reinekea sp. MED297] [Reinekea blandensis MED297]